MNEESPKDELETDKENNFSKTSHFKKYEIKNLNFAINDSFS